MRCAALALALVLASGCVPLPPDLPPDDACGAPALQGLVGQPASVLATMRFAVTVRVIRPGDAVTEDYSPERLNIVLDAEDVVTEVWCG